MKIPFSLSATVTLAVFIHCNATAWASVDVSSKPVLPAMNTFNGQVAEQSSTGRRLLHINETDIEPGPYGPRENYETFATTWGVLGGLTIITGVVFFLKDQWRKLKDRVKKISETERAKRASRKELFRKLYNFKPGLLFTEGPGSLATVTPLLPVSHEDTSKGQQEKLLHETLTNEAMIRQLFDAVTSGDEEAVRSLIQSAPVLVNMVDCNGNTVLHYVSANGLPTLAPFLLEHGADPELLNNEGLSALHIATIRDFHYLVELYLDWILNISNEDIAMLFYASVRRDDGGALLNSLIRRGLYRRLRLVSFSAWSQALNPFTSDLHPSQGENGITILHQAVLSNNPNAVTTLLNSGIIDVNATDDFGNTALHYAVVDHHSSEEQSSIIQILVQHHININARNHNGFTALHRAAQRRQTNAVLTLLAYCADPNIPTHDGDTALMLACERAGSAYDRKEKEDTENLIATLAKNTKTVTKRKDRRTPLHALASIKSGERLIKTVCKSDVFRDGINKQDSHGNTALNVALLHKKMGAASSLVNSGARTDIRNFQHETAEDIATRNHMSHLLTPSPQPAAALP